MKENDILYYYQAFQLTFKSEFELPELLSMECQDLQTDVVIHWGDVDPQGLANPLKKGVTFQASSSEYWLNVPQVARFLVKNGHDITIDPAKDIDHDSIRVFLLGSCLGALLMQRGIFLLHGNVIHMGDFACAFTGASGVGKSTLAATFLKRGYLLLADDICAINKNGEVIPGFPQIKLWYDAAKQLEIHTQGLRKSRPNIEKYAVPMRAQYYDKPAPLKNIYILSTHNRDELKLDYLKGSAKFQPLRLQTYRLPLVQGFGLEREHKQHCARLANLVQLAKISRPTSGYTQESLADMIEDTWRKKGATSV